MQLQTPFLLERRGHGNPYLVLLPFLSLLPPCFSLLAPRSSPRTPRSALLAPRLSLLAPRRVLLRRLSLLPPRLRAAPSSPLAPRSSSRTPRSSSRIRAPMRHFVSCSPWCLTRDVPMRRFAFGIRISQCTGLMSLCCVSIRPSRSILNVDRLKIARCNPARNEKNLFKMGILGSQKRIFASARPNHGGPRLALATLASASLRSALASKSGPAIVIITKFGVP